MSGRHVHRWAARNPSGALRDGGPSGVQHTEPFLPRGGNSERTHTHQPDRSHTSPASIYARLRYIIYIMYI